MKDLITFLLAYPVLFVVGLLTGCTGGGGGGVKFGDFDLGDIVDNSSRPFSEWPDVGAPDAIDFDGESTDASYVAPAPAFQITSNTDNGFSSGAKATIVYDSGGAVTSVAVATAVTTVIWKASAGDLISSSGTTIAALDPPGSKAVLVSNALHPAVGWQYQTYGVWATGLGQGAGTYGAATFGVPTAGSAIPTVNSATFNGSTVGGYVDPAGDYFLTSGTVSVNADFVGRSLAFTSSGTQTIDPGTGATMPAGYLNMTGTLSYAPGSNAFTGPVTATGLAGTSSGQFYGPNAEELGGVFSLSGVGVESYQGAYGAKR